MIVTSASGYVAGTYLSTAAVAALVTGATVSIGASAAVAFAVMKGIVGSALVRLAGPAAAATVSGTGAASTTGALTIVSGPVGLWISAVLAALGIIYGAYRVHTFKKKLNTFVGGREAQFTESEVQMFEKIIRSHSRRLF